MLDGRTDHDTLVRVYPSIHEFTLDAAQLAKEAWSVVEVNTKSTRSWIFFRKTDVTVTYKRLRMKPHDDEADHDVPRVVE